jgi:hypothetical protein
MNMQVLVLFVGILEDTSLPFFHKRERCGAWHETLPAYTGSAQAMGAVFGG